MAQIFVIVCGNGVVKKARHLSGQYLVLALAAMVLALVTYQVLDAEARYLLPANYRVNGYRNFQPAPSLMPILRRQDADESSGPDEDPDDADDQNAAASYRQHDDAGNQDGRATDGFEDNEPGE